MLIRGRFIDIKSLHVMYYEPFHWSMVLLIINELLNVNYTTANHTSVIAGVFQSLFFWKSTINFTSFGNLLLLGEAGSSFQNDVRHENVSLAYRL